jgi:hypothetical protein
MALGEGCMGFVVSELILRQAPGLSKLEHAAGYVFSGVRPSPGAETLKTNEALELIRAFSFAEIAVAEDGHTPPNRYAAGSRVNRQARMPASTVAARFQHASEGGIPAAIRARGKTRPDL